MKKRFLFIIWHHKQLMIHFPYLRKSYVPKFLMGTYKARKHKRAIGVIVELSSNFKRLLYKVVPKKN